MRRNGWLMSMALVALFAGSARAQDFGVLESAETLDKGNFKLMAYPVLVFGEDDLDNEFGVAVRGGYGISDNLDIEAKAAFYDGLTFIGGDLEFWLLKGGSIDVSVSAGGHFATGDFLDTVGVDLTALGSTHLNDRFELFVALDVALESISDAPEGVDDSFTTLHVVPGIEYKLSENLDLVAELGLAINDDAANYLAGGFAYYLR